MDGRPVRFAAGLTNVPDLRSALTAALRTEERAKFCQWIRQDHRRWTVRQSLSEAKATFVSPDIYRQGGRPSSIVPPPITD